MVQLLSDLRERVTIGFVGGSDIVKQQEQLKDKGAPHLMADFMKRPL